MFTPSRTDRPAPAARILAIDWLRGIAGIVMIQCHALALLLPELRQSRTTQYLLLVDGLVAPAFFFSAGFAQALLLVRSAAAGSRNLRLGRSLRRIGVVFAAAAFVNTVWFHSRLHKEPWWLWRMDILLCMGLALLLVLPVAASLCARPRALRAVAVALALLTFGLSPLGEAAQGPWAWVLNKSTGAVFPLLPWLGFAWLGAYAGAATGEQGLGGLVRALLSLAGLGALGWLATSPLRHLYPPHAFFVTNPANAAVRWFWVCTTLLALVALERLVASRGPPSLLRRFIERFGTATLSAYVIHEMLLYHRFAGLSFHALWGGRSGWGQYALRTVWLIALTFCLCVALAALLRLARQAGTALAGHLHAQRGAPSSAVDAASVCPPSRARRAER